MKRKKKVLISMGHPAQYHFFKHTIKRLKEHGHEVCLVIKTKDILEQLLKEDGQKYYNVQEKERKNRKSSILIASLKRSWEVIKIAWRFKPDILLGTGADVAHAGWLLRKPCVTTLEDDICLIKNLTRLTYPFTRDILVPVPCSVGKYEGKKIGYEGYMKLAYLHPNEFTPNAHVLEKYHIQEPYVIIRMVKLTAYHDKNIKGLNIKLVNKIIDIAESNGYRVFINAEKSIHPKLEPYKLDIKATEMHDIMAHAAMLISDSQSMSVEAAMLGVPNIRFSDFAGRVSVLEELEGKYRLTCGIKTEEKERLLAEVRNHLSNPILKEEFAERRKKLLEEKIDVTAFLTWFIENYPESRKEMRNDPKCQYRFLG